MAVLDSVRSRAFSRRDVVDVDPFLGNRVGRALLLLGHGPTVAPAPAPGNVVVLIKAGIGADEGKISRGGNAHLGTDTRGRKHWVTDKQQPAGDRHPAAAGAGATIEGSQKAFSRIGVEVTEETAEKSGNTYIGFAGNTYAQLAQFRKLKDQGLCWGFRKSGKFLWACKPENLQRVTEAFHGPAQQPGEQQQSAADAGAEKTPQPAERTAEAGPGPAEPRSDRGGDGRGGPQSERGGDERVPAGAEAGSERTGSDDRRTAESGTRVERGQSENREVEEGAKPAATLRELMTATASLGKWDVSEPEVLKFTPHTPGSHSPEVKKFLEAIEKSGLEVWHSAQTQGGFEIRKPGQKATVVDQRGRQVQPESGKIKSMAEIQGDSAAREAARPKEFGKYGQEGGIRHWQVSEEDYVAKAWERSVTNAESNATSWRRVADDPKQRPKARREAESHAGSWDRIVADKKAQGEPTEREKQHYRDQYMKQVRQAISTGELVPHAVINQRPEFQKARDARERYDKGRHTSFANKSIAVRNDIVESHGTKVKRQDGKDITDGQVKEIGDGIREMEEVLGPLGDIFRGGDVTIAHTNGKFPFLSQAGGLFHSGENTVTVGIAGCKAMAHELAHFLDFEAGRRRGKSTSVFRSRGPSVRSSSLAAANNDAELVREAARSMNDSYKASRIAKVQLGKLDASEEEKAEIKKIKVQLGAYWRRPEEIFARLVEQHIATEREAARAARDEADASKAGNMVRIREASRHASHERVRSYENMPGWWDKETFARLQPMVRRAIADRLEALGADPSHVLKGGAKPMTKAGPLSRMRYWFRSLLGRNEDILELTDVVEEPRPPCCAPEPRVVVLMRTR